MLGATEPVTLSDPDGSVTRIAPWASWSREQVRPPGGDALLVTRLDRGQLWFSSGLTPEAAAAGAGIAAPWRQEVHVGPAVVTTTAGRCHVVAEPDGGATVTCLEGEVRVGTRARAPVQLTVDQAAAVSGDGETLVVLDRAVISGPSITTEAPQGAAETVAVDSADIAVIADARVADRPPALVPVRQLPPQPRPRRRSGRLLAGTLVVLLLVGLLVARLVLARDGNHSLSIGRVGRRDGITPSSVGTSAVPPSSAAPTSSAAPATTAA
ncbi:MAG: hypothetical protein JWN46_2049, partial [Acidimicrobiales bacterium]|nr:hypothetical protein [Acidimicrobiales bacterium]